MQMREMQMRGQSSTAALAPDAAVRTTGGWMVGTKRGKAGDRDFQELIGLLDGELHERYPRTQSRYDGLNRVAGDADAVVAYDGDTAVGCGCLRDVDGSTAELKRMYVRPAWRGRGIARLVLAGIEELAREKGKKALILETGINQPEAIGLYGKAGYARIENYGEYAGLPENVCMRKELED